MARKAFQRTQKNTSEQPCEYAPFNLKNMTHEEAIDIVRKNYPNVGVSGSQFETALRNLIPELCESEDERMVREFNDWLCEEIECRTNDLRDEKDRRTLNMLCYVLTKVKDWLEKQKDHFRDDTKMVEQKSAENGVDIIKTSALLAADRLASAEMTGRLKERSEILENPEEYGLQKPAEWSEEDENMMNRLIGVLDGTNKEDYHEGWEEIFLPWLKSFRPQPKQEWSEEDKKIYQTVFNHFNSYITFTCSNGVKKEHILSWLKSLRPQPHWKPSEEQMRFLLAVINEPNNAGSESCHLVLKGLYEQLKNL